MTSNTHFSPSATDLARLAREQLAEIRVEILRIAHEHESDTEMAHKLKAIQTPIAKVFRGINSLLQMVQSLSTNA